jgi:tRNA pseudouridine55 synthase
VQFRRQRRDVTGILLLDKPYGISSNEALQRVKTRYRADKAGHTGSLDPLATGVLPICLGDATKLCGVLLESDKGYLATVRLGARTSTGDAEGEIIETSDPSGLRRTDIEAVLPQFAGVIQQVPPMYSALKRDGQPLYALARAGIEIEREPREVAVHQLELKAFDTTEFKLEVRCSKGTYIRTLAEDIVRAVGHCAHLSGLRRTAVSPFEGKAVVGLEQLDAAADDLALDALLMPPAEGLRHWPQAVVDEPAARDLSHGRPVNAAPYALGLGQVAVLDRQGNLLALAEVTADGRIWPRRWLQSSSVGRL